MIAYFPHWPVKNAAAEALIRSPDAIDTWIREDVQLEEAFLSARPEYLAAGAAASSDGVVYPAPPSPIERPAG